MPRIAIIPSTTRCTRFADQPTQWIAGLAAQRPDLEAEVVDLRDYPMPFFNEVASNTYAPTQNEVAVRWQQKIAEFDGFIFVTAEYNHAPPAVLKNALDYAYPEWNRKPVAFVGYGAVGAARAIEQLCLICVELQMVPLRSAVHLQGADFFAVWREGQAMDELTYLPPLAQTLFDELVWWAQTLNAGRSRAEELKPTDDEPAPSEAASG